MKTSPHRMNIGGSVALLLLLAFASGISAQTTQTPASLNRASRKSSSSQNERSDRTASGSERDQDATLAKAEDLRARELVLPVIKKRLVIPLATARGSVPTEGIQKRDNEWGIWGGISFNSPTLIGQTPNARFGTVGLRYGRVLAASKTVAFEWTIDAVPLAILSNDRFAATASPFVFTVTRKSVYGAGAAPIGLKFNFRRNRRFQPFGQATGGFLYFTEQVPVAGASQFNFTFDFSGGVQIVNSNRRSFTIGYKYGHISNGYTGTVNPGVDVQMIFAGFSIFK